MLTIDEKQEINKSIDTRTSYTIIAENFGIARSMVANIRKDASKVEAFKKRSIEMGYKKATSIR